MTVHWIRMPVGFGSRVKTRGRLISVMAHLKKTIIEVKTEDNCLAHALLIAIQRINKDPKYESYRKGYKIRPVVQILLTTTGINLYRGGGIRELAQFQDHFKEYRIVVFSGLKCDEIYFDGQVKSEKRINLLYDELDRHYHVITDVTGSDGKTVRLRGMQQGM